MLSIMPSFSCLFQQICHLSKEIALQSNLCNCFIYFQWRPLAEQLLHLDSILEDRKDPVENTKVSNCIATYSSRERLCEGETNRGGDALPSSVCNSSRVLVCVQPSLSPLPTTSDMLSGGLTRSTPGTLLSDSSA